MTTDWMLELGQQRNECGDETSCHLPLGSNRPKERKWGLITDIFIRENKSSPNIILISIFYHLRNVMWNEIEIG